MPEEKTINLTTWKFTILVNERHHRHCAKKTKDKLGEDICNANSFKELKSVIKTLMN